VRILAVLERRTASPNQLATELGVPLGNVSYHVRMLARLGLIKLVSRRQRRGAIEHFYKAAARTVISDETWAGIPDYVKGAMVQAGLAQTVGYVQGAAQDGGFNRREAHLSRTTLEVDEEAWQEVSADLAAVFEKISALSERTAERLAADPHAEDRRTATVVLMLFEGGEPATAADAPAGPAGLAATTTKASATAT
jgi:DNA-binding transcriptional ArsR family regulator